MRATIILAAALLAASPTAADDIFGKARNMLDGARSSGGTAGAGLAATEVAAGLKEALRVGAERVVDQVSAVDGFNADPAIHIPLPSNLQRAQQIAGRLGASDQLDELETRLNRAAEAASGKAKGLFADAVAEMTIDDARQILNGPDDAATSYFRERMTPGLVAEMEPIVDASLAEVGALKTYEDAIGALQDMPMMPDPRADLSRHVIDRGLDGIFHYIAREEAAIRKNPTERTTALLQKVFAR